MSTDQQQAAETQTIEGVVVGIITKSADSWQIAVTPEGSQYNKNLWTKDAGVVDEMTQRIGHRATFYCNVSHWTRQDGQPVRSLWVNGYSFGYQSDEMQPITQQVQQSMQQTRQQQPPPEEQPLMPQDWMPQQAAQQQQPQPQPQPVQQQSTFVPQDVKELRIMREAADKCAAWILASMVPHMQAEDLTPERLHGFMDMFAQRRIRFYETGSSFNQDDIPFLWDDSYGRDPGIHFDPWR